MIQLLLSVAKKNLHKTSCKYRHIPSGKLQYIFLQTAFQYIVHLNSVRVFIERIITNHSQ